MSYKFIIHPNNEKLYSIHSEVGRQLLQGYLKQQGGAVPNKKLADIPEPDAVKPDADADIPDADADIPDADAVKPAADADIPEPDAVEQNVEAVKPNADAVEQNVEAEQEHKNKKVVSLEDPIRARIKAQFAPWVARWEQLVELLRGSKTNEGQSGGNSDYMKNLLTFIV